MSDTTLTKLRTQTKVQDKSKTTVSAEVDKVIIGSIAAFTGVVGLWSVACLMRIYILPAFLVPYSRISVIKNPAIF